MGSVKILTVVPVELVPVLRKEKRVTNYNNMPQISEIILAEVRKFIADKIGYDNYPLAGLASNMLEARVDNFIPVNSKNSVLFQLEMSDDMVVSLDYQLLLEYSNLAKATTDKADLGFIIQDFRDNLVLGIRNDPGVICFIPFLDYSKCKQYAKFNSDFEVDSNIDLPGIEKVNLKELVSFLN